MFHLKSIQYVLLTRETILQVRFTSFFSFKMSLKIQNCQIKTRYALSENDCLASLNASKVFIEALIMTDRHISLTEQPPNKKSQAVSSA